MDERVGQGTCGIRDPRAQSPKQTLLTGWAELVVEACDRVGNAVIAQVDAGFKVAHSALELALARDPSQALAWWGESWRYGFDCLLPMTVTQFEAARFLAALGNHVMGGMQTVGEASYQRRLSACRECEFFHDNHCLQCGCRMAGDVFAKARWRGETCPMGRWATAG
jgi:hypothetical protein